MQEGLAVALQFLQDEALPAEKSGAELLVERDAHPGAHGRAEEGVLLANQVAPEGRQVDRHDLARIRRGEGHVALHRPAVGEVRHEKAFARQYSLSGPEELAHEARIRLGSVAHPGLEGDVLLHPVHGAGLGDDGLLGIQFHLHRLEVVTVDAVVDFVAVHHVD